MRGLTLWQPWASAVAVGSKRIETRSWATPYQGPIAIHASTRRRVEELIYFQSCWSWCGALRAAGWGRMGEHHADLPYGAVVAVGRLVECRPTDTFTQAELDAPRMPAEDTMGHYGWTERMMGDYALGRFGWVLADIRPLSTPYPYKGALGLWRFKSEEDERAVLSRVREYPSDGPR